MEDEIEVEEMSDASIATLHLCRELHLQLNLSWNATNFMKNTWFSDNQNVQPAHIDHCASSDNIALEATIIDHDRVGDHSWLQLVTDDINIKHGYSRPSRVWHCVAW